MILEYFGAAVRSRQREIGGGTTLRVIEIHRLIGLGIEHVTHLLSRGRGFSAHHCSQLNRTTIDDRWTQPP